MSLLRPAITSPCAAVRARVPVMLRRGTVCPAELVTFDHLVDPREHLAIVLPSPAKVTDQVPLIRVHSECLTGDAFGCDRCECGPQLDEAIELIGKRGGALLYLRQEGRDIGLYLKLDAYLLQDLNYDTYEANRLLGRSADERDYRVAAQMLRALGMPRIDLLTNNPDKVLQLQIHGIDVAQVVPSRPRLPATPR